MHAFRDAEDQGLPSGLVIPTGLSRQTVLFHQVLIQRPGNVGIQILSLLELRETV